MRMSMSLDWSSIKKIALVSHNYNLADEQDLHDYSQHFVRINNLCDEQGCDTILYALYTWDERSAVPKNHESIFGNLAHIQRVIMEIGQPTISYDHVEVWLRHQKEPLLIAKGSLCCLPPARKSSGSLTNCHPAGLPRDSS